MIRPVALYIGLRYTRAKRRNHFISFISLASMIGIALGVMVLITVLSVMNGFDYQIRTRFFAVAPQVTVMTAQPIMHQWQKLQKKIDALPEVRGSAPYISGKGLLLNQGAVNAVAVMGVIPQQIGHVSQLAKKMVSGDVNSLQPGKFHMVIGQKLANRLGLVVGDSVNVFTPQTTITPFGVMPQFRRFTISGIFSTHSGFGFDNSVAYINFDDAAKLFPASHATHGFHIRLHDIYAANRVTNQLLQQLPGQYFVTNWTQQYGAFFHALAMEKTMMFVILLLIVAVAVFNLVATLVMVVNDKRTDIAILRTLGARPRTIMSIFIIQGAVVGIIGTVIGMVLGIILALNVTAIVSEIQHLFHVQLISSSVYIVNYLPSRLQFSDVFTITTTAIGLSLLATLYPASIAFRTQPAEALRYE